MGRRFRQGLSEVPGPGHCLENLITKVWENGRKFAMVLTTGHWVRSALPIEYRVLESCHINLGGDAYSLGRCIKKPPLCPIPQVEDGPFIEAVCPGAAVAHAATDLKLPVFYWWHSTASEHTLQYWFYCWPDASGRGQRRRPCLRCWKACLISASVSS